MKKMTFWFIFACFFFIQCKDDSLPVQSNNLPFYESITSSVNGRIINELSEPISGAIVSLNNQEVETNEEGFFSFIKTGMNKNGTYIKVRKAGYFLGSRRFYPEADASHNIRIQLLPLETVGSIEAAVGGEVAFDNGNKIKFQPNSIVDASGNTFNGNVNVSAQWINPVAENISDIMPGDLTGITETEEYVSLASYGMMAVELSDDNGNELNGSAELTFPVPEELMGSAPDIIPLWYFDEEIGIWKEEGSATLTNGKYVGNVEHFSFWNCDAPFPLINFKGKLFYPDGTPGAGLLVEITMLSTNSTRSGTTNSMGIFQGKIPANDVLEINIYDDCGILIHQDIIGPFTEDTVYPISLQNNSTEDFVTIMGNIVDCDGNPISEGVVYVTGGNGYGYSIDNSTFDITVSECDLSNTSLGFTFYNSTYSAFSTIQVPYSNNMNLGMVSICNDALSSIDSITIIFPEESDSMILFSAPLVYPVISCNYYSSGDSTSIVGMTNFDGEDSYIRITFLGTQIGNRTSSEIRIEHSMPNTPDDISIGGVQDIGLLTECSFSTSECPLDNFEITDYGNVGEGVIGSYQGTLYYQALLDGSIFVPIDVQTSIIFNATRQQ